MQIRLTFSANFAFQVNRFRLLPPLPFLFFNRLAEKAAKWLTFLALFAAHGTRQSPFFSFTLTRFFVFPNSVNYVHCMEPGAGTGRTTEKAAAFRFLVHAGSPSKLCIFF